MISPPKKVKSKVVSIKKRLNTIMKLSDRDLYSTPHISLLKLKSTNNDSSIIFQLKLALKHAKRFQIKLTGLGRFDNKTSNTVYIKIANPEPITSVYDNLQAAFAVRKRNLIPHLTIARGISAGDLENIQHVIPDYRENFYCNSIVVLKKPVGDFYNKMRYTKIYEASLS